MESTKILFIHSNPKKNSLSHLILNDISQFLLKKNITSQIYDLYKLNFNPCLSEEEIVKSNEPKDTILIQKMKKDIIKTNILILIYPVWWFSMPAILKGWIDRILHENFAYSIKNQKYVGLFQDKKLLIIRTHGGNKNKTIENISYEDIISKPIFYIFSKFCGIKTIFEHDLYKTRSLNYNKETVHTFILSIKNTLLKMI